MPEIVFTGDVSADLGKVDAAIAAGPFTSDWDSLAEKGIPEWYRDAKFGIFT